MTHLASTSPPLPSPPLPSASLTSPHLTSPTPVPDGAVDDNDGARTHSCRPDAVRVEDRVVGLGVNLEDRLSAQGSYGVQSD